MRQNYIIVLLIFGICGIIIISIFMLKGVVVGPQERLAFNSQSIASNKISFKEEFNEPIDVVDGKKFTLKGDLTFELFRNGTFFIDGASGLAWQKSKSYRDSAIIRSTNPLPKTYKISVLVGDIQYDLSNLKGLKNDPEYSEGPRNENGCYLIAITDEAPIDHYTNDWWHEHRKVVIDVDNNVWGHGMPNPIFMVYFDNQNELVSFDGETNQWQREWKQSETYEQEKWYWIELEKTQKEFIFRVSDEQGQILKEARTLLKNIWHQDGYPDYFVIGDPHENYYQGSFKIKSISINS